MTVNLSDTFDGLPAAACKQIVEETDKATKEWMEKWVNDMQGQVAASTRDVVDRSKHDDVKAALVAARSSEVDKTQVEELLDSDAVMKLHEVDDHVVV